MILLVRAHRWHGAHRRWWCLVHTHWLDSLRHHRLDTLWRHHRLHSLWWHLYHHWLWLLPTHWCHHLLALWWHHHRLLPIRLHHHRLLPDWGAVIELPGAQWHAGDSSTVLALRYGCVVLSA